MQRSCTWQHASPVRRRGCLWVRECLPAYRNHHSSHGSIEAIDVNAPPLPLWKQEIPFFFVFSISFSSYSAPSFCTLGPKSMFIFFFLFEGWTPRIQGGKKQEKWNSFSPHKLHCPLISYGNIENKLSPYWQLGACDGGKNARQTTKYRYDFAYLNWWCQHDFVLEWVRISTWPITGAMKTDQ